MIGLLKLVGKAKKIGAVIKEGKDVIGAVMILEAEASRMSEPAQKAVKEVKEFVHAIKNIF